MDYTIEFVGKLDIWKYARALAMIAGEMFGAEVEVVDIIKKEDADA